MAPPAKPTLTVSTTTSHPHLGQNIIPGLGEPYISRSAHEVHRLNPHLRPRPIIPFSAYYTPNEAGMAETPRRQGTKKLNEILSTWATEEEREEAARREGTRKLRAILAAWKEEEARAAMEPFPRFDEAIAFALMVEELVKGL